MNSAEPTAYTIREDLLQAIVGTLNELPAGRVRPLLNTLEAECRQQDQARAEKAQADKRAAIEAEVKAALAPKADDKPVSERAAS